MLYLIVFRIVKEEKILMREGSSVMMKAVCVCLSVTVCFNGWRIVTQV